MSKRQLVEEALTKIVIGAFYEVYNTLGYGFREYIYALAMERELVARGLRVEREVWIQVMYKGDPLALERIDMLVEDRLVVDRRPRSHCRRAPLTNFSIISTAPNSRSACS
jgi:GxxExxY protein